MLSKNQIREIQSLQLKKFRDQKQLFIAEGIKTVAEIVEHRPALILELFATKEFIGTNLKKLQSAAIRFTEITEEECKKISMQATPSGVLALCHYFKDPSTSPDLKNQVAFYLDDIRDPGNFGTILRLSDWFGMSTVFCSPASCDLYNPKVIQSTMGAFLRVTCIYTELNVLVAKHAALPVYGAVLHGNNLYKQQLGNGLIVIGNEANGISDENLKLITHTVTIPANQNNGTESLNAAMAASILASEFFRQLKA